MYPRPAAGTADEEGVVGLDRQVVDRVPAKGGTRARCQLLRFVLLPCSVRHLPLARNYEYGLARCRTYWCSGNENLQLAPGAFGFGSGGKEGFETGRITGGDRRFQNVQFRPKSAHCRKDGVAIGEADIAPELRG